MVTYSDLFNYTLVICAIVSICISVYKSKKYPPQSGQLSGYFLIIIEKTKPSIGSIFYNIILLYFYFYVKLLR